MGLSLLIISACLGIPHSPLMETTLIEPDLRDSWCQTQLAWWPHKADLDYVLWCKDDKHQCKHVGGGAYDIVHRTIYIDPDYNLSPHNTVLTMEHEYGHALGLKHVARSDRLSIMNEGWDLPLSDGPTEEDLSYDSSRTN